MSTVHPIKSTGAVTGTQVLDVPNGYNYYRITIESASAQTYTIKCLVQEGARYTAFDSNTMGGDESATFYLPYTEGLQFIPSSTDEYTAIVAGMKSR